MSSMANVLSTAKRVQIVSALVEGCGIRATARMADVSKDTVMKLWREIGEACIRCQDEAFRNLTCKRLQVDEIWSFVYAKAKKYPLKARGEPLRLPETSVPLRRSVWTSSLSRPSWEGLGRWGGRPSRPRTWRCGCGTEIAADERRPQDEPSQAA